MGKIRKTVRCKRLAQETIDNKLARLLVLPGKEAMKQCGSLCAFCAANPMDCGPCHVYRLLDGYCYSATGPYCDMLNFVDSQRNMAKSGAVTREFRAHVRKVITWVEKEFIGKE